MARISRNRWFWAIGLVAAILALIGPMTAMVARSQSSTSIYVSPSGNDANPGTQAQPVRTLQRARDLVRSINQNMSGDITVFLNPGTYRLSQPLALNASDSGTNGHNVVYTALNPAQPTIVSGGVPVTGWAQVGTSKIWSAPAPAAVQNTRQLYVNGVRALRARGRLPVTVTKTDSGFTASASTMATWRNRSEIEFVFTGGNPLWSEPSFGLGHWTEPRCPVGSIQGTTITMAQPCWDNSTKRVKYPTGTNDGRTISLVGPPSVGARPAYIENAFELLNDPGEWYFDRAARIVYYIPRPGENLATATIEAPVLETLVSGHGTPTSPIHHIVFSGLQFSYATWLRPSSAEGFSEIQATYTLTGQGAHATQGLCQFVQNGTCPYAAWTKTPGNLSFSYVNNLQFLDSVFIHLGGAGLELGNGSQSNTVKGNIFTDISANGLELGDVNIVQPTAAQLTKGNQVLNNHFYALPVEFRGGVALFAGYTQNTTIQHNQIDHTPYSGMSIGWGGWPDKIQKPAQPQPSQNNVVANNLIFDYMLLLADGSSIYTNGLTGSSFANGEKVIENVVHDQFGSGYGIYTDNGASFITIKNNVIFDTNHNNWGIRHKDWSNGGQTDDPTLIEGNYWQQGDADSSALNVIVKDNHLINALDQAPASILQNAGLQPAYQELLQKQFMGPTAPEPPSRTAAFAGNGFAYVAWQPPVFEGSSPVQSYTVTSSKGNKQTISASAFRVASYIKMTGLTNGTAYTFTVSATNADGTSSESLPSGAVTPSTKTVNKPTAPQAVTALPGNGMASVHFKDPTSVAGGSHGGSPVISYTVVASPGGRTVTITGRPVLVLGTSHYTYGVIDGLQNGQKYTLTVTANNVAGQSAAVTTTVTPTAGGGGDGAPFGGTPRAVPGTIQAEDFNTGGQGVAFNDTDATNNGGAYRPSEAVDIQATTDTGGGNNVGWTRAGEWLKYTVNVGTAGTYTFNARVASAAAGASFHAEIDGVNVTSALSVPSTGGNQTWTTVSKSGINLTAGQHVLRVVFDSAATGGIAAGNYNFFSFSPANPGTSIEAENCTLSQAVVATNHTGFMGTGFVDYTNVVGGFVECTVSAAAAGSATVTLRYASGTTTNRPMSITVNGTVVNSNLAFNPTTNWDTWATQSINVTLNAGANTIRATATTVDGGPNLDRITIQ